MTTKQLRFTRVCAAVLTSLAAIIAYTIIIKSMPLYMKSNGLLMVAAQIIRIFSAIFLLEGVASLWSKDKEEDTDDIRYSMLYFHCLYLILLFAYFLAVRVFGYNHFRAYCDNMGALVVLLAIIIIASLCIIRNRKFRRLLFENKSWRKDSDNETIMFCTSIGIVACIVVIIVTVMTEHIYSISFKPSKEDNGYGYVDLGLKSGTKWADHNLFARDRHTVGVRTKWGQTVFNSYDERDIAKELMGERWSVPSLEQWNELIDRCKCIPSYYGGEYGVTFISKKNRKRIFLPAPDSDLYNRTTYWTATPDESLNDDYYRYDMLPVDLYDDPEEDTDMEVDAESESGTDYDYTEHECTPTHASTIEIASIEHLPWWIINDFTMDTDSRCYIRPVAQ